ncbi:hypothetical protein NRK67_02170 [Fusobacteria bacterium ZRK30]|nr:hypothetical protein NRK67_02170 [Fusobacteria bacterium ZRK30]
MKRIILGMMLVMGSLSFAANSDVSVKTSKISDSLKNEKSQDQNSEKSVKISNIFDNYKPLNTNN